MYALNLAPDWRILSATDGRYGVPGQPVVESLPSGDISNYKYLDGKYIYDPLPAPEPPFPEPSTDEILDVLLGVNSDE